jgi:hypothetical protein
VAHRWPFVIGDRFVDTLDVYCRPGPHYQPNVQARSLEPGLAQTADDVIDRGPVDEQPLQIAFDKGQVLVQPSQLGERGLRLLDPPELGEASDDIAQTGRPVAIERPGPAPDLDRLVIIPRQ